jgi:hypothetical protein
MARMKPTQAYLTDVRRLWEKAESNKERKKIIDEAREPFGYSYSNMTRLLKLKARKRSLSAKQAERAAELKSIARKVYDFRAKAEGDGNGFSVEVAYQCLKDAKQIPEEITLSMVRRKAEEIGLSNEYASPARKFHGRSTPLHLVLVDYSKSEYFRYNKNGQIFMEKYVEKKKDEPRLFIAAAVDWTSRVAWFKYYIEKGESAEFVRKVLLEAFEEKPDFEGTGEITGYKRLLQGIPKEIYFDRGKGNMSKETASGLLKLQVKKISGSVEIDARGRRTKRSNKKARGMIEKFIGDFKRRFEARLWGRKLLGDLQPDFTLMELNEWAMAYCEEMNCSFHPLRPDEVRWNIFKPALSEAVFPPEEAKMYFTGCQPRTVQRRLIMGKNKETWFIAPEYINDGQKVDVLFSGSDAYMYYDEEMVKLKPQAKSMKEMMGEETGLEIYSDHTLRDRFAKEILNASGGEFTIRTLSKNLKDDISEFYEKPRSVSEIKERATYFINVSKSEMRPANIIQFKKE